MISQSEYLSHLVRVTTEKGYTCVVPGTQNALSPTQLGEQVERHANRFGYWYNFAASLGAKASGVDLPGFALKWLYSVDSDRGPIDEALNRLSPFLSAIDLLGIHVGSFIGTEFVVVINGDHLAPKTLPELEIALNAIGECLLDLTGVWKMKVAGYKWGKGMGLNVNGTAVFTFSDPERFDELHETLANTRFGTSFETCMTKSLKMCLLNPLLFGHRGNVVFAPSIFIRRFDGTVRVKEPSLWGKLKVLDRFFASLTVDDFTLPAFKAANAYEQAV